MDMHLTSKLALEWRIRLTQHLLKNYFRKNAYYRVEKQCAHFFGVTINEEQAESGIVVRVTSAAQSKFKLLYFKQDANGGYGLALQPSN